MNRHSIEKLFQRLNDQPKIPFPKRGQNLEAPYEQGVYVIRGPTKKVLHVGRSQRARWGLWQRLNSHLQGYSSFVFEYLDDHPGRLRNGYTFQCLVVKDPKMRALLEHFATAWHCPAHLGLGESRKKVRKT